MSESRKLDIGKISELTTGSSSEFKEEIGKLNPTLPDLRALKEAEKGGKNRDEVIQFIDKHINAENVAAYLGMADGDIGELSDLINEIERVEDLDHFDEESIDIDQDRLINLVGGTVDELKEFAENNPLTAEQLQNILDAEKKVKDRKTAKKYLERKIEKRKVGEDVEKAKEDLENLKSDLQEVRADKGLESEELEESDNTEESVEKGKSDKNEEEYNQEPEKGIEDSNEEEKEEVNEKDENPDSEEEKDVDEASNEENQEVEDNIEEVDEANEDAEESEVSEEGNNLPESEEKHELVDELDLDMSEDEIEQLSLEDLRKIKDEKDHREELIQRLEEEGMTEEELRDSSTTDLEKIAGSLEEQEESKEEHEEMREEAEEDLEMLMGAVRWDEEDDDEEDTKSTKEKLQELKENFSDKLSRGKNKETNERLDRKKVEEVLDQYRSLNDEEAAIKTAHIMKGFLENNLEIERELTYKELAENMPREDKDMNDLAEFFIKLHREQYTGKLNISDSDEVIDTCESVIKELA